MHRLLPIVALTLSASAALAQQTTEAGERVSILRLVANPDPYDGKVVFVKGYVTIALENMSVCSSRQPLTSKDCLWLEIDGGPWESNDDMKRYDRRKKEWRKYHRQVVSIRAVFDKNDTGHFGGSSGGLRGVTEVFGPKSTSRFAPDPAPHQTPASGRR